MKKIFVIVIAILMVMTISSCGMGWKRTVKDFKSNYDGGLLREIIVTNAFTDKELWHFKGKAFINDGAEPGDAVIIYTNEKGDEKKFDVIGYFMNVTSNEL